MSKKRFWFFSFLVCRGWTWEQIKELDKARTEYGYEKLKDGFK